jgi:hypothetical protein
VRSVVIYLTPSLDTTTESVSASSGARDVDADPARNVMAENDRGSIVADSAKHDVPSVQAL